MKFSKDQNTLTLDDGTDLVAAPVGPDNTCRTCMVACRFQRTYDNTKRCGSKFRCSPSDRTDGRDIVWKLKKRTLWKQKKKCSTGSGSE